jgi:hypothetical protein
VVAKVTERLAVKYKDHIDFIWRGSKFNKVQGKEQFRIEVSNRFEALDAEVKIKVPGK